MKLPLNFYTQWYWKTDLHNLLHFLALRADAHAQYEIRAYAEAMLEHRPALGPAHLRGIRGLPAARGRAFGHGAYGVASDARRRGGEPGGQRPQRSRVAGAHGPSATVVGAAKPAFRDGERYPFCLRVLWVDILDSISIAAFAQR